MGLLQRAVETYNANQSLIGEYREGHEPLVPIGHTLTSANIEITINHLGKFLSARKVDKSEPKIIIPVTEESGGRTNAPAAHPLCDQLKYISPQNEEEYGLYCQLLRAWSNSTYSHPFLYPILTYVENGSILSDLEKSGNLLIDDKGKFDEKQFICWRVNGFDGEEPACWKNKNLFQAFIGFYEERMTNREQAICMLNGETGPIATQHPKGIIPINGNAKIISANDKTGFTYRGRFSEDWQAATVSYVASQKAHNALRWLASEQGVREFSGNRIYLCWNPQGRIMPSVMRGLRHSDEAPQYKPSDYRAELRSTLFGLHQSAHFDGSEVAIVAAFDAATTGRLALTYYNEVSLRTFLERMETWDAYCCWYAGKFGIQSPSLKQIVDCAFGTQRGAFLETDDRIQRQHLQKLLNCKVNGGIFPVDIVKALAQRASTPLAYEEKNWRRIVHTACAVIQKYHYDTKQGGDEMSWELDKKDRSFQFGRLLAVLERAEQDYYQRSGESRQTNAIKFMAEYRQRPWLVFERINRQLHQAYLNRVQPWQANRYERLVGEICGILKEFTENELNYPLAEAYLMGYELQRNAFFTKNNNEDVNETEE